MASFLYYFPNFSNMTPEICQIPHLRDVIKYANRGVEHKGPDGNSGVVWGPEPKCSRFGYYPDEQHWQPVKDASGTVTHWLGISLAERPTPADLRRPKGTDGYEIELGDGNQWLIPVVGACYTVQNAPESPDSDFHCELWVGHLSVPRAMSATLDGQIDLAIKPEWLEICRIGKEWFERYTRMDSYRYFDFMQFVTALLACNYRVGLAEVSMLGLVLMDNKQHDAIQHIALGFRTLEDEEKKNQERESILNGSSITANGDAA